MILLIIYSFRMGVEAVLALMKATPDLEAMVVSLDRNSSSKLIPNILNINNYLTLSFLIQDGSGGCFGLML